MTHQVSSNDKLPNVEHVCISSEANLIWFEDLSYSIHNYIHQVSSFVKLKLSLETFDLTSGLIAQLL